MAHGIAVDPLVTNLTIFVLAVALGIPLGVISAVRRGGVIDRALMISGLVAISIPSGGLLLVRRKKML